MPRIRRVSRYRVGGRGDEKVRIGVAGELKVMLDLMEKDYQVFRAISPSATVDLVAIKNEKCYRVEVTKGAREGLLGKLRWPRHDPSRYDVLAVWESDGRPITYLSSTDEPVIMQ